MNILVINCGSSSIKYQIFDMSTQKSIFKGIVEEIGKVVKNHQEALAKIIGKVNKTEINCIGHRIVHGGEKFVRPTLISSEVLLELKKLEPLAPLHNPYNVLGIEIAQKKWPELNQVAVFDTSFHSLMPRRSKYYALDYDLAEKEGIKRYGFHGTSHQYVAKKSAKYLQQDLSDLRLITLHLGNGASACAIEFGKSVDTSMGMTPLEGLVMGTRSGDIDAGVVLKLLDNNSPEEVSKLLNKGSGLKGISGLSNDLREIEKEAELGNDRCRLAINIFAHRVRKYIGSYAAVMGGVDAIVFTGGIGENSVGMRRRILQRFDFLGLTIDEDLNNDVVKNSSASLISTSNSKVKALVVNTNEELMIATETKNVFDKLNKTSSDIPVIPIAVSARHLHLDKETFAKLFGEGSEPTKLKDISQPGQYACKEQVNLIGPRETIEGVRLLGPLRSKNQIEISRTDEFKLGVDAPIRNSGKVKGSAPIIVEGPVGKVSLTEGLICARRHIHAHPDDAKKLGIKDKDIVEVEISGGERDLTFGDVLVRVKDSYVLEMHIDTDEANACELVKGTGGSLVYENISGVGAKIAF